MSKSREFMVFSLASAFSAAALTLWQTLLPLYLDNLEFAAWQIGVGVSLTLNLSFLLAFPAGYLVDRIGWKRSALFALLLSLAAPLVLIFVTSFEEFLLVPVLAGLSSALFTQSSVKVLVRSGTRRRGLLYSSYILLSNIGRIVASYASGFIALLFSYQVLYACSAFSVIPALLLLTRSFKESSVVEESARVSAWKVMKMYLKDTRLKILVLTLFLHDFAVFVATPYLALYAKYIIGVDEVGVSLLSGTSSFTQMFFQLGSGWLADKIGGSLTLAMHFIGISAIYVAYSQVTSFLVALALYAAMGLIVTLDLPARRLLITKYAPEEYVGAINGFADSIVGVGTMLSAALGGYLWSISPSLPILAGGLLNLSTLPFIFYLKYRKIRLKAEEKGEHALEIGTVKYRGS
ncbi:MAG TPA: MFS transporter [Thermofilum sp.]|nr:MFS transporter [Thermofilum sp.]